jgi:hypothetical protein
MKEDYKYVLVMFPLYQEVVLQKINLNYGRIYKDDVIQFMARQGVIVNNNKDFESYYQWFDKDEDKNIYTLIDEDN